MGKKDLKPPAPIDKGDRKVEDKPTIGEKDYTNKSSPNRDKTRTDFRTKEFIRKIRQKGYYVKWRKALLCPCFNAETEQVSLTCTVCDGSGYYYVDPHEIQAIITKMDSKRGIYRQPGMWLEGSANATVEPQYRIGYRDSLEMKDSIMTFNEYIQKGNRRGIRAKLPDGVDSARYRIVNMTAMVYKDVSLDTIVRLQESVHYEITDDGWIKWLYEGEKIADGTTISIHYDFHPVWIVISHPYSIRDTLSGFKTDKQTVKPLPIQGMVQLDYLIDVNEPAPVTGS